MARKALTPAREAELLARYANETNQELADAFGLRVNQVTGLGQTHGLRKSPEALSRARLAREEGKASTGPMADQVLALAQGAGAVGITQACAQALLPMLQPSSLVRALYSLTHKRHLHRGGKKGGARFFVSAAHAAAFDEAARATKPKARPQQPCGPALVANGVQIAHQPGPALAPGLPIVPAGVVPFECPPVPGPEARWHRDAPRHFLGRIGQYDEDTPASSWVKALTERATA